MEFFEVVHSRRAVRQYKPDLVSREDIMKILDAGNWAPSGKNLQPWEFVVVTGKKKEQLGESYGVIGQAYAADWDQTSRDAFVEYARTYGGAPVVLAVLVKKSKDEEVQRMYMESGSAAMENIVLAARALGLGTCWMTGPLADEATLREVLGVGERQQIVAVTPLGYPVEFPQPIPRVDADLSKVVRWLE